MSGFDCFLKLLAGGFRNASEESLGRLKRQMSAHIAGSMCKRTGSTTSIHFSVLDSSNLPLMKSFELPPETLVPCQLASTAAFDLARVESPAAGGVDIVFGREVITLRAEDNMGVGGRLAL
jgi:hypothetical protein